MVSERSLEVLRVIVQDYVASREPVGSKSIVDRHSFGVSAATIRNDMALLEEEELIVAPHTSSGRIPTDKGYRLFVDHLASLKPLSAAQRQAIETFLATSVDIDEVLVGTVRLLSQLTQQVALVQYPSLSQAKIRHVEIVALSPILIDRRIGRYRARRSTHRRSLSRS
jgi:heat-inducible transcriptional repressor